MSKLLLLLLPMSLFCQAQQLIVATDLWDKYTSEQSDGLYEELLRQVFSDFEILFEYTDYTRTKAMVVSGTADIWLGAYKDEEDYIITPREAMDADFIYAIYVTAKYPEQKPDYMDAPAAWFTDYLYDQYFPQYRLQGYEVNDATTAFRLLNAEKVRFILGDNSEMLELMAAENIENVGYSWIRFGDLALYPAFSRQNPLSSQLAIIWDEALLELKESGQLETLFEKHGLLDEYPFVRNSER